MGGGPSRQAGLFGAEPSGFVASLLFSLMHSPPRLLSLVFGSAHRAGRRTQKSPALLVALSLIIRFFLPLYYCIPAASVKKTLSFCAGFLPVCFPLIQKNNDASACLCKKVALCVDLSHRCFIFTFLAFLLDPQLFAHGAAQVVGGPFRLSPAGHHGLGVV